MEAHRNRRNLGVSVLPLWMRTSETPHEPARPNRPPVPPAAGLGASIRSSQMQSPSTCGKQAEALGGRSIGAGVRAP